MNDGDDESGVELLDNTVFDDTEDYDDDESEYSDQDVILTEKSEEYIEEQLNATVWSDLKQSLWDIRLTAPIFALLGMFLAYHITIAPYRANIIDRSGASQIQDLALVRPMLTADTLKSIQNVMLNQENELNLPWDFGNGTISMRFVPSVNKYGTHELPEFFYEGVMFGISAENSHDVLYSTSPDLTSSELHSDLLAMRPSPSQIMTKSARCNSTTWHENGFGVYFSYKDLEEQGMLSSDPLLPWKRMQEPIMWIARKFKQVYITVWYPKQFGVKDTNPTADHRHRHTVIIQSVIPTRTGLDGLKSTAAVWMTARNASMIIPPPRIYKADAAQLEKEKLSAMAAKAAALSAQNMAEEMIVEETV